MKDFIEIELIKNNISVYKEMCKITKSSLNNINFNGDGFEYHVQYSDTNCYFSKNNKEFSFTIDIKNDIKAIKYELKEVDALFDINYKHLYFEQKGHELKIYYNIETDEADNIIIIRRFDTDEK